MQRRGRKKRERERERDTKKEREGKREAQAEREREERETVDRETILTVEGEVNVHRDPELAQASRKSRRKQSLESREFSAPLSLSHSLLRSLARLFRPFPCPSLSYAICLSLSRSLSPFSCTQFSLVSSFFLSFLFASVPAVVLSVGYSIGRSVRASGPRSRARRFSQGSHSDERARVCVRASERTSDPAVIVRARRSRRFPLCSLSFSLSIFLSLSLASLFLSLRIRRTPGAHSVVKNPAAARRSYTQLPLL